jgi:undecaprenyl-diphosphatase
MAARCISSAALASLAAALAIMAAAAAGYTGAVDQAITLHLRGGVPDASGAITDWARGLSWIGDFPRRMLIAAMAAAYLAWCGRWRAGVVLLAAILLVGATVEYGLKPLFDRPRPDIVPWLTHATAASLPSGHAAGAAVTFPGVALFLGSVGPLARHRRLMVALGIMLALAIGWSRLWLGVHWASDVLAGWALGASAALAAYAALQCGLDAPGKS